LTAAYDPIQRAAAFLERMQAPDGMWRDFGTMAGRSSEWVTAFVLRGSESVPELAKARCTAAAGLLRRQRENGGWGFNRAVPTDCDSTAWSLLALTGDGLMPEAAARRAGRYVISHQHPNGGFATFAADDGIDAYIDADEDRTAGWLSAHVCVSGVALQALTRIPRGTGPATRRARAYLLTELDRTGLWNSYWWKDWTYATYHALRGLLLSGWSGAGERVAVLDRVAARQNDDGGWAAWPNEASEPFATAFGCLALMRDGRPEHAAAIDRATDWLRAQVRGDGSVAPRPILRIPPPMVADPGRQVIWRDRQMGTGVTLADEDGVFTTAAVLWALSLASLASPPTPTSPR
jgi:squalene cyclase